jgi:Fic family protein
MSFDMHAVGPVLLEARRMQGVVEGKAQAIGIDKAGDVVRHVMAQEVIATAAIEGEKLDPAAVRSSVRRRLGLVDDGPQDRRVDGLVDVLNDAAKGFNEPLDDERLCRWQSALFPAGTTGIRRIAVGRYRDHHDPMRIVSGPPNKEVIHYEAPPSHQVAAEMRGFLSWFVDTAPKNAKTATAALTHGNARHRLRKGLRAPAVNGLQSQPVDGLARAAIAHLWFESIHPFEDGNGRIGRAIVDLALAQHQQAPIRLFSLSGQMLASRRAYYTALNQAQTGSGEVTEWVKWFAQTFSAACRVSSAVMDQAIAKSHFWVSHADCAINARQRKVIQRLLDDGDGGFAGGLNAEKYIKMTAASKATATRDLSALVLQELLWTSGQGKGLRYFVNVPGWAHDEAATRA